MNVRRGREVELVLGSAFVAVSDGSDDGLALVSSGNLLSAEGVLVGVSALVATGEENEYEGTMRNGSGKRGVEEKRGTYG